MSKGKSECFTVVLTVVRVIWCDLRKVLVEAETAYGSDTPEGMVRQYFWVTLQAHRVMEYLLRTQLLHHP